MEKRHSNINLFYAGKISGVDNDLCDYYRTKTSAQSDILVIYL